MPLPLRINAEIPQNKYTVYHRMNNTRMRLKRMLLEKLASMVSPFLFSLRAVAAPKQKYTALEENANCYWGTTF